MYLLIQNNIFSKGKTYTNINKGTKRKLTLADFLVLLFDKKVLQIFDLF